VGRQRNKTTKQTQKNIRISQGPDRGASCEAALYCPSHSVVDLSEDAANI